MFFYLPGVKLTHEQCGNHCDCERPEENQSNKKKGYKGSEWYIFLTVPSRLVLTSHST